MQATEVATTNPTAPYDVLTPMRCMAEPLPGQKCTGRSSTDIDWNRPTTYNFKCPRCKTQNLIRIVEARPV